MALGTHNFTPRIDVGALEKEVDAAIEGLSERQKKIVLETVTACVRNRPCTPVNVKGIVHNVRTNPAYKEPEPKVELLGNTGGFVNK
jgi:hypothetical protein